MSTPHPHRDADASPSPLDRRVLLGAAGLAGIAALAAGRAKAGPIDPPAGPVGPTAKPLSEVEPRTAVSDANTPGNASARYRITRPGSYYLLDNILNVIGKHGVEIASSDVTLDLCGFELTMLPGAGSFDGVTVPAGTLTGITVLNGTLRNWGRHGLNLSASHSRVEGVRAASCGQVGIFSGDRSVVSRCSAVGCGSTGVVAGFYASISDCTASANTFTGIAANAGSAVERCTAEGNGTTGISGGGTIARCAASNNGGDGISVGSQGTATGCVAIGNSTGIRGSVGAVITACTAAENTQSGISVNDGGSIIDCAAMDNTVENIRCADGCLVRSCNAFANNSFPTQTNIRATGGENRLEHNNATGGSIGFSVGGAGNILIANTARNNTTNYALVAGNICLVVSAAAAGAISGSSGGVSPGTTNPWANFAF